MTVSREPALKRQQVAQSCLQEELCYCLGVDSAQLSRNAQLLLLWSEVDAPLLESSTPALSCSRLSELLSGSTQNGCLHSNASLGQRRQHPTCKTVMSMCIGTCAP